MNRSIGKTISVGFGLALSALLAVGLLEYATTKQLVEAGRAVAHTDEVLTAIQTVLTDVKDSESWMRGYAATGDQMFLAPCRAAIAATPSDLRRLRQLTSDNPRQQRRLGLLEPLLTRRFQHMERVIELRREGGVPAASEFMKQGEGLRLTRDIKQVTDDMLEEEGNLLRQRTAAVQASKRRTDAAILAGTLFAIGLLLGSALLVRHDMSQRQQAEEALRQNEEAVRRANAYNRSLLEASLDPLATISPEGRITDVNNATEKVTGYSRSELLGTDFLDYFTDPGRARAGYQKVFREGWVQDYELEIRHRDGHTTPVLYNASIYKDENGTVIGVFAAARDISERKKAERELFQVNRALKALSECNEALVRASGESELLERVCQLLVEVGGYRFVWVGYAEHDAPKNVRPVAYAGFEKGYLATVNVTWADEDRGRGPTGSCIRTGQPCMCKNYEEDPKLAPWRAEATRRGYASSIALPLITEGQTLGALTVYSQSVNAFDGEEVRLLGNLATDLAFGIHTARVRKERKQAEEEIRRLNQDLERRVRERTAELEATNQELEAFSYSVSHDLRAPLRHIDGFSRLLLEEYSSKLDDTARHYLDRIRTGTFNMGRLVDDLLGLSRIGRRELTCELTGLGSLVKEVVNEFESETLGRTLEWKVGDLPFVECDPALMKLVFQNLLSNACKFTRPREVAIIEVGQTLVKGQPAVFIRDNGVGFSMQHADKLFGVFQRLHRQADFEGTGVGLATVQRIIHKHGGRIWAEGEMNRGATFFFTLPSMQKEESRKVA